MGDAAGPWSVRVGGELRRRRERAGWSQPELGLRMGMMQSTVSRLEHGEMSVTIEHIVAIAAVFGLNPSSFIRRLEEGTPE